MKARSWWGGIAYWLLAVGLAVFGSIDLAGAGAPLFLTGAAMIAVGRWRTKPAIVLPVLLGVWILIVVYVLVGPGGCTSTSSARPVPAGAPRAAGVQHVRCSNPLGIDYSGTGDYRPTLLPGFLSGLVAGAAGAYAARRLLTRD